MVKFYAIKRGYTTGIFTDWNVCKQYVIGYPNAKYKSFPTMSDANTYLNNLKMESTDLEHTFLKSSNGENKYVIYTDGSCVGNTGGYGIVIVKDEIIVDEYQGKVPTKSTNNIAELYAVLQSLKMIDLNDEVIIRTDSKYVIGCLTNWINRWKVNGFLTSKGKPIENKELIVEIHELLKEKHVIFEHVFGHTGNIFNERADYLANMGRLE